MKIIAIFSSLIIITPFLGIPVLWKTIIFVISGIIILIKALKNINLLNKEPNIQDGIYTENDNDYKE